jgi:hypothetical protein
MHSETSHQKNERLMASWTRRVGIFTAVLAATSIVTGVIFFYQWRAMHEANEDTRNALIAIQRAFVFVETTKWQPFKEPAGNDVVAWNVYPHWENSGNTPTRDLEVQVYCPVSDTPVDDPTMLKSSSAIRTGSRLLGPKQTVVGGGCHIGTSDLALIMQRRKQMYLVAEAHYRDIFDSTKPHVTKYCVQFVSITGDLQKGGDDFTVISAPCSAVPDCADDECEKKR